MKVAFISPELGSIDAGGVGSAVSRLAVALTKADIEVDVLELTDDIRDDDGVFRIYTGKRSLLTAFKESKRTVMRLLNDYQPDIVHAHGLFAAANVVSGWKHTPVVVTAHGSPRHDFRYAYGPFGGAPRIALASIYAAYGSRKADAIIGVNPRWQTHFIRCPKRFTYIPNIVPEEFFNVTRSGNEDTIVYFGGNREIKGASYLFAAWPLVLERIRNARLIVCGWDREVIPTVSERTRRSIEFEEWASQERVAELLGIADLVVVPSRYEVSPLVVAEAWAAKVPVVTCAVGGIPAMATGAALLIPPDEPYAYAKGICDVLTRSFDVQTMIDNGAAYARSYREKSVVNAHIALYRDLLGAKRNR